MKHSYSEHDLAAVATALAGAGVDVSSSALELCLQHLSWVLDVNAQLNLTAVRDPKRALSLHLIDSLLALEEVRGAPPGQLADIGTGGGFPGLPLCVAASRRGLLIDSVQKKARALDAFLVSAAISGVTTYAGRSEELALERRGGFSVCVARAVAELPVLVELASPLLCNGGHFVAMKGPLEPAERERGATAGRVCGLEEVGIREYRLPGTEERRVIACYAKSGDPEVALPRRPGTAKKRPFA